MNTTEADLYERAAAAHLVMQVLVARMEAAPSHVSHVAYDEARHALGSLTRLELLMREEIAA